MKKQFIVMASLATILGLSFYSASHTKISDKLAKNDEDKSYIVLCDGDVFKDDAASLKYNRNKVLNQITYNLPQGSFEVVNTYDTLLNGFEIKVNARYEDYLKSVNGVSEVLASHTYARPEAVSTGLDSMLPTDAGYETRELRLANYSAETMDATNKAVADALKKRGASEGVSSQQGKNITVGIIDTGLYLNQVEGSETREKLLSQGKKLNPAAFKDLSAGDYSVTKDDVISKGFKENYFTHVNNKVFFARDYDGGDNNVDPTSNGSEHGTHVASLAGANGDVFQGIAPKAQIAVMKVFPDYDGGASEGAVIKALEDAAKLKLDVVNLSLGTDLNTSGDNTESAGYRAINAASKAGVIVNYAAGNSGKSSFSSSASYGDWTRDMVETSILGGESHFDESANIVAASNPEKAFFSSILTVQNKDASAPSAVAYNDQAKSSATQPNVTDRPLASLLPQGQSSADFEYVVIPGWGKDSDYEKVDRAHGIDTSSYNPKTDSYVSGKIAVVSRGTTSFVNKYLSAASHGAKALIVINNDPSVTFNFSMDFADNDPSIPIVFVFQNSKGIFGLPDENSGNEGKLTIATNTTQTASDGNMLASFSSDGGEANLDMGVTVAAPGKEIMGAVSAEYYNDGSNPMNPGYSFLTGYENMSGTSMAAPNFTGALALYLSERKPDNKGTLALQDAQAFENEKKVASMKAMSSTEKLLSTSGDGNYASPRVQGAGRIDVEKMLTSDSYITVPNEDTQGFENTVQSKVELKNSKSLKVDFSNTSDTTESYIEFDYTIHNDSAVERTYKPALSVMVPSLRVAVSHDEYDNMEESSKSEVIGYNKNSSDYPYGVGQITTTVLDDLVKKVELDNVVVPANGEISGKCKVRIDNLPFEKEFNDSQVENFKGTLKEYYQKYFEEAGGNYIEGYLDFEDVSTKKDVKSELSVPFMGFYGDYTKADAVEAFDFEREEGKLYGSDLVSNYVQNLADAYKKPYAYAGSTLAASASGLTSENFARINTFDESTKPNGTTYLTVTDGKNKDRIYAGAPGVSEHLIGTFFVNRAVSDANYEIINKDGKKIKGENIRDLYTYGTAAVAQDMGELMKSFLVANGTGFMIHRGYVDIDLSTVPEGEYTLKFNFKKIGTGTMQVKQYTLVVDKTAPTLAGLSITQEDGDDRLNIVTHGASFASVNVTVGREMEEIAGTDLTSTYFWINDSWKEEDKMFVELTDHAHNTQKILVKPSQIDFSVSSTFFTSKQDYDITLINASNGNYTYAVDILNAATGDSVIRKQDMTINMNIAKNLNVDDIKVFVDGESVQVNYNAETGLISFTFSKDAASFTINHAPASEGTGGGSTGGESSGGDSSSGGTTEGGTSTSEPEKGGCGGSVVIASSTVGALALLGAAVAIFKKKADK